MTATAALLSAPRIVPRTFLMTPSVEHRLDWPGRHHGIEVRAKEDRLSAGTHRRQPGVQVPGVRPDPGACIVRDHLEAEVAQLPLDTVGHLPLFAGWARNRGELDEEGDDVRGPQRRHGSGFYGRPGLEKDRTSGRSGSRGSRDASARTRPLERRTDEVSVQRRRTGRARLELGVKLARHEPGMIGKLDHLDEAALLEGS